MVDMEPGTIFGLSLIATAVAFGLQGVVIYWAVRLAVRAEKKVSA